MKTLKAISLSFLFSILFISAAIADGKEKLVKDYHKDFAVKESTVLEVINKFGDVTVTNWTTKSISIDVKVSVESNDKGSLNELIKKIEIYLGEEENIVKAVTKINGEFHNVKFQIDYEIKMPKDVKMNITNKFGNVFIYEMAGKGNINVSYGDLRITKVSDNESKPRTSIVLAYSDNSSIQKCNWLSLEMSYSKINIAESNALMIISKYSKISGNSVGTIVAESKYDDYKFSSVNKFICNGAYANYKIDKLGTSVELEVKYSDVKIAEVAKDFTNVMVTGKYSSIKIKLPIEASYAIKADAEYCDINLPATSGNLNKVKQSFKTSIWGNVGKDKTPASKVTVISKYGEVNF
jgi:hypothetical protein